MSVLLIFVFVLAQAEMPTLDLGQLALIGLGATLVAQILKLVSAWFKKPLGKDWVTVIAFVVSVIMAYLFLPKSAVAISDPMQFASDLIEQSSVILGTATLVYNVLLEKIFDKLGWTKERVLQLRV
jgi:hypothetical protein